VNQQPPEFAPPWAALHPQLMKGWMNYAYHLWTWTMATEQFPVLGIFPYSPSPKDYELGRLVRSHLFQFLHDPQAMDRLCPPWVPFTAFTEKTSYGENLKKPDELNSTSCNSSSGIMRALFVYGRSDRYPYVKSSSVGGYKQLQCATLRDIGFDEGFWWCN
jgi:hypothetical protein